MSIYSLRYDYERKDTGTGGYSARDGYQWTLKYVRFLYDLMVFPGLKHNCQIGPENENVVRRVSRVMKHVAKEVRKQI